MKHLSHRYLLFFILAVIGFNAAFAIPAKQKKLTFPRAASANIGVIVRDLQTGEDVVRQNPDKFLTPASILKCVTSASVLLDSKGDSTLATLCTINGSVTPDGTLLGDLTLIGCGDPTLESPSLDGCNNVIDSIATALRESGITRIAGCIVVDSVSRGFPEQGPHPKWEVEDLQWSYGAGLYTLNYRNNTERIDRAVTEPVEAFVDALEERLQRDSIAVEWNEDMFNHSADAMPLFAHHSPPAKAILRELMVTSNNLYAEGMLRMLSPGKFRIDALTRECELLSSVGLNADELIAFDGSGLTRNSKLTPQFMADLLSVMAQSKYGELYVSLFPKVGVEGTVKKLLKGTRLEGKLALKSGSMNGVQCFAGYKFDDNGKPSHSVVIMVNSFTCKRSVLLKAITDFLLQQF